jgi:para-aminobenzoate synthetase component 1
MNGSITIPIKDVKVLAYQLCRALAKVKYGLVLYSNGHRFNNPVSDSLCKYELLAAVGSKRIIEPSERRFEHLNAEATQKSWLFGFFGYDLKNEVENLSSGNADNLDFPEMLFFEPEWVFAVQNGVLTIYFDTCLHSKSMAGSMYDSVMKSPRVASTFAKNPELNARTSKEEYISTVDKVLAHIKRGDIYEMNLCQEFYAENAEFNPIESFIKLNEFSPTPFSAFGRFNNNYVLCASPERYLCKRGETISSQPIKGTGPRGITPEHDEQLRESLRNNTKERAENIMIVDLVRNDLSRVAAKGSVKVDELCGVYPFRQVNQLISTVSCKLRPELNGVDAIKASFPMGSMTGAPKIRAMELIDKYESTKRGLFSGAIGYFDPDGDFDFNVVIRSLLYNKKKKYLSLSVGGAITIGSKPEDEYNECLLKAAAAMKILQTEA